MIEVNIPGRRSLTLQHLVMDYNGTLALDGQPYPEISSLLQELSQNLQIHILTADTHGRVHEFSKILPGRLVILPGDRQGPSKRRYVKTLGAGRTVAVGNGRNDEAMLRAAVLGIAILGPEGCFTGSMQSAQVVFPRIEDAMHALIHPLRLTATLRG